MAFNPLESFNQGFASGEKQKISGLRNALAGQMGQNGFDSSQSNEFQQYSAMDPDGAARILDTYNKLDEPRKKAIYQDARTGLGFLEKGDYNEFLDLAQNRIEHIERLGGDPSGTLAVLNMFNNGDIDGAINHLKRTEQIGIDQGLLSDPLNRQLKEAQIANMIGKSGGSPKLGTYNPSDYTVKSWSEFAKKGDPSILERYQSDSKTRQAEISEQVQVLKNEKFELTKQKDETERNRKELEDANKKRDIEKIKYLEIQDAKNTTDNISSLLSSDLDLIYGGAEWLLPDKLRSQSGKNMLARKNQVVSSLKLLAAGKLKGQGSITENERIMLAQAATTLENQDIDPTLAQEELKRILPIYNYFINGEGKPSQPAQATSNAGVKAVSWSDL